VPAVASISFGYARGERTKHVGAGEKGRGKGLGIRGGSCTTEGLLEMTQEKKTKTNWIPWGVCHEGKSRGEDML